jgi:flavorubredoxin
MAAIEIKPGVFWVGAKDWNRKLFDSLIPLPLGTTYNSYLVKGKDKSALVDTVNPGFENVLLDSIKEVTKPEDISFLVMNHAEPDHAGSLPAVLETSKNAQLVTTKKGAELAKVFFKTPEPRIKVVADGDVIDLGGKSLLFLEAPMLHWPETMFTYLREDKVLFPCDFLGLHTASGFYDDEVEELIPLAKTYFGEIMMPFRKMGQKALEKIAALEIEIIAPSHGPIHQHPETILEAYKKWTAGKTKEKAIVAYVSMWKSTEAMVSAAADALLAEGIEVAIHNVANANLGDIAKDLVDSRAIVFGVPTVIGGMHPLGVYAATLVKALRPPLQYAALLSSYGWGGGAMKQALEMLGPTGVEVVGTHEIKGTPSADDLEKIRTTGRKLAAKIKG